MKAFRCLNCGFIFRTPETRWRLKDEIFPDKRISIPPENLYEPLKVCPRCGSDAIQEVELQESSGAVGGEK